MDLPPSSKRNLLDLASWEIVFGRSALFPNENKVLFLPDTDLEETWKVWALLSQWNHWSRAMNVPLAEIYNTHLKCYMGRKWEKEEDKNIYSKVRGRLGKVKS